MQKKDWTEVTCSVSNMPMVQVHVYTHVHVQYIVHDCMKHHQLNLSLKYRIKLQFEPRTSD